MSIRKVLRTIGILISSTLEQAKCMLHILSALELHASFAVNYCFLCWTFDYLESHVISLNIL